MRNLGWSGWLAFVVMAAIVLIACASASSSATVDKGTLIRMEVIRPEGPPIRGVVEDGSYLLLQSLASGKSLAFKPDIHRKPAKVQVFRVGQGTDGGELKDLVDETEVQIGASTPSPVAQVYSVRITEVLHPH